MKILGVGSFCPLILAGLLLLAAAVPAIGELRNSCLNDGGACIYSSNMHNYVPHASGVLLCRWGGRFIEGYGDQPQISCSSNECLGFMHVSGCLKH